MSPEFQIRGKIMVVDIYNETGRVTIIPRVLMGESIAKELQKALGGRAWVLYDPSATYVPVQVRNINVGETLDQIVAFLRANDSRWFLPRE